MGSFREREITLDLQFGDGDGPRLELDRWEVNPTTERPTAPDGKRRTMTQGTPNASCCSLALVCFVLFRFVSYLTPFLYAP
jgi:hypothetical protein